MSEEKEFEALKQEIVEQWSYEELVKLVRSTTETHRETRTRNQKAERKTANK